MSLKTHTFAAGETHSFGEGDVFVIVAAAYPVDLDLRANGRTVHDAPDAPVGYKVRPIIQPGGRPAFDDARVTSDVAQTVTVAVATGDADVNAITGTVNVAESYRATAQEDYSLDEFLANSAAGNAALQLWNPAGSGELFVVDGLSVRIDHAGAVVLSAYSTALATGGGVAYNKFLGAASRTVGRNAYTAGVLGDEMSTWSLPTANETRQIISGREAQYIVPPGWGLVVTDTTVNQKLSASFRFKVIAE